MGPFLIRATPWLAGGIRPGSMRTGTAMLTVYDLAGRVVATLLDGPVPAGTSTCRFHAGGLASGVYFAVLSAEGRVHTQKLVLMK